jgi:hypothetical protein
MKKFTTVFLLLILSFACTKKPQGKTIVVKNNLDINRAFETVEISTTELKSINTQNYKVIDTDTNEEMISQVVDSNLDGTIDVLLFQPEIKANSKKAYRIEGSISKQIDSTLMHCYSRFVPERTDDYAWENNRVAFRTFGPTAQKMIEDGVKGGTLTSGMDAWLKRVDYPIINKWYAKDAVEKGAYHKDTGEGLDNFHVGVSRGVGGTAVKTDSSYAVSKNFTAYKTITNGPIRTSFILEYENWDANGKTIKETKLISLDYGQNLSKHKVNVNGTDKLSAGLTLHKKDGITTTNKKEAWMSYWEPFDDSELGQGLVASKGNIVAFDKFETDIKDKSNLYAHLKVTDNIVEYYAGFGWKKSGQFDSKLAWEKYLSDFALKVNNPLTITFK